MKTSLESTASRPSFSIRRTVTRERSRSVKNSVSPAYGCASSRGWSRARSRIFWAFSALVVQTFWPLIVQPPSRRLARVLIREVSEPASGSVIPNADISSPRARAGSQAAFISSDPWWITGVSGKR